MAQDDKLVTVTFTNIDTGQAQTVTATEADANMMVTAISNWRLDEQWFVVEVRDADYALLKTVIEQAEENGDTLRAESLRQELGGKR